MLEAQQLANIETGLRKRYIKLSKILIALALLLVILIVIVIMGVYIFEMPHNWMLLSLETWVLGCIFLIGFLLLLIIVFYFYFHKFRKKRIEEEKPKPEYYKDKRLYVYTYPVEAKGGIFSKTYINIGDNSILRLRTLMIHPEELWKK